MKDWFKARNVWGAAFLSLSDEEAGQLVKALWSYTMTGEEPDLPSTLVGSFAIFKMMLDQGGGVSGKNRGEKHWNWKGGKTPHNQKIRNSEEYRQWRKEVFERDNFKCQMCGAYGVKLNAHHIQRFADCVDGRFEISNGITLCVPCHKNAHKNSKKFKE